MSITAQRWVAYQVAAAQELGRRERAEWEALAASYSEWLWRN